MTDNLESMLRRAGAPGRSFWENDLEVHADHVWSRVGQVGFAEAWLEKRNGRQLQVLRHNLAARGAAITLPTEDHPDGDFGPLAPYYLIEEFTKYKSRTAIIDHARRVLPGNFLAICEKRNGDFDTVALCFALYHFDPAELALVLCLDKVYRNGFARMRLLQNLRRPPRSFAEFLTSDVVAGILQSIDEEHQTAPPSELRKICHVDDRQRVFIRRPERSRQILRPTGIVHGYRPEWIVLEFVDGGKRVNIASHSVREPLEIADRIATVYYGTECQYENENLVTYGQQLRRFLRWLQQQGDWDLQLVEVAVANSPLAGSPKVRISDAQSRPIGRAIAHFEQAIGAILEDVDRIESVKVLFREKRVSLLFERLADGDDEFVVRYSDHRLDPPDRKALEEYLGTTHGIAALSTEKRHKHAA